MLHKTQYLGEWDSIYVTVRSGGHGGCMGSPYNPNLHAILMDKGKITAPPPQKKKIVMGKLSWLHDKTLYTEEK